jgi:zinc-ribbon family
VPLLVLIRPILRYNLDPGTPDIQFALDGIMFIIFGITKVKKPVKNGLRLRRHCGRCHYISELHEHSIRPYFTLFFLPVIPIGKGETLLVCSRCEAAFYPQAEDYLGVGDEGELSWDDGTRQAAAEEKMIISCAYCNGRLRVPAIPGRRRLVTCPHCRKRFDLK